jgi:uncharacterized SAM-binding protein YcdF (DUF218 family)
MLFLYPLTWSILLLAPGILGWKKFRGSRWLCAAAFVILLIFSSFTGSSTLLRALEVRYPDVAIASLPPAQAIVVLGGAMRAPGGQHELSSLIDNSSDRLLRALRLYHAGKAPLILCTGGAGDPPEALVMSGLLQEWGVPPQDILLEDQSVNTRENALFSYSISNARAIRHILLVTSALHMPRAIAAFRKVGFEVTPAPADFRTGWGSGAGRFGRLPEWLPDAGNLVWSQRAVKEWIGLLVYRLRGWI